MSSQQQQQQRREPWRNVERHYCACCNVWMGSDKQSILLHENGKKHKEKAEESMQQKRLDRLAQERQASAVQASIQSIEAQARQALTNDLHLFANVPSAATPAPPYMASMMHPPPPPLPPPPPPPPIQSSMPWNNQAQQFQQPQQHQPKMAVKQEKNQWESRKQKREEERAQKKRTANGDDDEDEQDESSTRIVTSKRRKIGVNEGHYTYDNNNINDSSSKTDNNIINNSARIYLEGQVFGEILEDEMPIQLWTGPITSGPAERRLPERAMYWKQGLIAALRRKQRPLPKQPGQFESVPVVISSSSITAYSHGGSASDILEIVADVSYLENPETDTEETLVKSIPLDRIRIVLGDVNDDRIPETLEEARLLAMGGVEEEEVITDKNKTNNGLTQAEIDEATGLSGWSTIKVKRTTVRHEEREERERQRRKRREAAAKEAQKEKEALERKMEEAKVANADDSALGAYDVYSSTKREGYKGVHIHEDDDKQVQAHELVGSKKLSQGKTNVSFKKKNVVKKQSRRTTSADDED